MFKIPYSIGTPILFSLPIANIYSTIQNNSWNQRTAFDVTEGEGMTGQGNDPDSRLIDRCCQGDREAFELLVRQYQDRVFAIALRWTGVADEARELVQDVFIKVFTNINNFRGDALFSTWLHQITVNHCKNRLKYLHRRSYYASDPIDEPYRTEEGELKRQYPSDMRTPEELLAGSQIQKKMQEAIAQLPDSFKEVIILRDIEDVSYEEIAEITGLELGTVKSRIHRARVELKKILEQSLSPQEMLS